jgi:hypothetical protein
MGLFAGVDKAKMTTKLPPLTQGKYRLKIEKCQMIKVFKTGGNAFISEFEVVKSDTAAHPVGSKRSWYQKMEPSEIALGSLKQFAASFLGVDPRDPTKVDAEISPTLEKDLEAAVGPGNGFAGLVSDVQVDAVKTKENKDFNRHSWIPAVEA